MADNWQEYQEEVATFCRSLGLKAQTDVTPKGVRTTHDMDVLVKSQQVDFVGGQSRVLKMHTTSAITS